MTRRGLALLIALGLAACTGGGPSQPTPPPSPTRSPIHREHVGSVVMGAEQWPECLNPLTYCAAASWYWWTIGEHVLPRAMELDPKGNFVASPMLVEAPTLDNGGLSANPMTVRFRISPTAVWADGSSITASDFDFTWKAVMNTVGAYSRVGYDLIESVGTSDPKMAVVTFRDVYANWPDLFGGVQRGLLEKAAFPKERRSEKPNLAKEMQDNIPFSGGPWVLKSWSQDQAVLVRSDRYFGPVTLIDQLTFVPRTDQPAEIQSLLIGEIDAIYPAVSEHSLLNALRGRGNTTVGGPGTSFEALWINQKLPPLNDPQVRQALLYAMDRQAAVDRLAKLNDPNATVLNCGFVAIPNVGPWCRSQPFARYSYDPSRARQILEADGYDCSTSPCTKDGKPLEIEYMTSSTSTLRTTIQEILVAGALKAGIRLVVKNYAGAGLFGDLTCFTPRVPLSGCGRPADADPSVTYLLSCDAALNPKVYTGIFTNWCNPEAERLMKAADRELDPAKRLDLMSQVYDMEAQDAIGLPLFVRPAVSAWRSEILGGPIGLYNSSPYGLFFNMNEWYLRSA